MPATRTNETRVVAAARAGDRRALEELAATHLPLVYTMVRRALGAHPDVDDVVQDIMVRALRRLPSLRSEENFRPWLAAIALRQIGTHLRRKDRAARRTTGLEEAAHLPDLDVPSEDLMVLRVELSDQRRQAERASRWLDPDDRALLPLWWLELGNYVSRSEVAAALGLSVAHAGVRIQRMRGQLEVCRAVVAALETRPRCDGLDAAVADWNGVPSPLWRKRVVRHLRSCAVCSRATDRMLPTDRLFPAFALLPVPDALTGTWLGETAAPSPAGSVSVGLQTGLLHPVIPAVAAGIFVIGAGATAAKLSVPEQPGPADGPAATALRAGPTSLEAQNAAGRYVSTEADLGVLDRVRPGSAAEVRTAATFDVVPGLADAGCFSFRVSDGRYLRHASWRVRLDRNVGTVLFRGDATFCQRPGAAAGSLSLESSNYPGWFLRHRNGQLWVDRSDRSAAFRADSSFVVRAPLSR
ncbi:sigma-70 family RNA polymerase sigma factor [Jidongwangia harbinensis]|uniref:sigma-70 family RNA polymerase sigma factor n=1 Tax=Jidongwangia harbinensis TaxID=2878561 RepID=UPI001CD9FD69|nr:sigma-70 family RNA polymerase sigma factor [Jidongwangia harbinensis]MCA2213104.1 sigma-70 family RNA polymerase sigma factor [Jidongwangia harbinensis]